MSRPGIKFALLPLSVLLCTRAALCGGVNVPDWVQQAAAAPIGSYPPDTASVVLLDQTDYAVTGPGEYTEHSRWVTKILRPEGRESGDLLVDIGQGEKLTGVHAWTIDKTGHNFELKQKDFVEKGFSSEVLYSDIRIFTAKAPASDPGSVVAFEFEVRRRSFVNQINQFFQESDPVKEVRIGLSLPPGWEFKDSWPAGSRVAASQTAPNHWEWSARDLPGIQREPRMPGRYTLLGRLSISFFAPSDTANIASWEAMGRWYNNLTAGRRDPDSSISEKVQQLVSGRSDFDSKLLVLTRFLQNEIRYVAIEIGVGGYQPHPARDVFRYRYGDCKDKATLLSSMLKVAGISSDYVVIHTQRGFVNPQVPSIWFNHVILAIELPDSVSSTRYGSVITSHSGKRYLIFDPTDEYTPVGHLRSEIQNSYALLVTETGGELIRTPLLSPGLNRVNRTGHFSLNGEGNLSGEVVENRSGDFASEERGRLHYTDERERKNDFERWLSRSIQNFSLENVDVQQAEDIQQDLLLKYKFSAPQYGQARGSLMLVRPRVLDEKSSNIERKQRRYPLLLARTADESDDYEIELPHEFKVDDLPDPVKIDVGFASYQSKIEVEGSKLHYRREYIVRDLSIPPERYGDWIKLQGLIGADESATVVLKRVP